MIVFPNVAAAFTSGLVPPSASIGGTNYTYALFGGDYVLPELSGSQLYVGNGQSRLYVTGNVAMSGSAYIYIAPGASLKLYVGGSNSSFGSIYHSGGATDFQYYGLSSNTNVAFSTGFAGTIYAPNASVGFTSVDSTILEFIGACVARDIKVNGRVSIHFDEALVNNGPTR